MTWNKVSDHEVQFKLTASPVPTWFAVGFSHAQKGKNLMIGPPASESVCFELQKDGTGKLAHVSLDSMPPSDTIGKPLASNSSVDIVSGGKASVSFTIDTKLGNYKIPGPDGQTHTFIYAYGESSESSGALGMAYHSTTCVHWCIEKQKKSTYVSLQRVEAGDQPCSFFSRLLEAVQALWQQQLAMEM